MSLLHTHGWRLLLVASGVLLAAGGRMHPGADGSDTLRQELATMTADERWVPGHALVAASTALLALGLWAAVRSRAWPATVQRTLTIVAVIVSVYVVETVFHLAAVVDSDELAHGHAAPVAMTHIGLATVLYPVTGWAIVFLAHAFGRAWTGWRRAIAAVGIVAGLAHAFSVPLTLLLPQAELSPVFAVAGMSLALFSLATGLVGAPQHRTSAVREPALAG
jgi:hypothetical protein